MKRLVLVGSGHAHLFVLEALARYPRPDLAVILITPGRWQYYSGMLPGWMAGHYRLDACRIDMRSLAKNAGALLLEDAVVGMDADQHGVCLPDGRMVHYDLVSLDTGSETNTAWLAGLGDRLLPVKPIQAFAVAWESIIATAQTRNTCRLIVVGGGAAGVELAMAAHHALGRVCRSAQIMLVAGDSGLLSSHGEAVRQRVIQALKHRGIEVFAQRGAGVGEGILLEDGRYLAADQVIAATGARAPVWLELSHLALDSEGYVRVDAHQRSCSHPDVFAAGDVCARYDVAMARSGVQAVRAGPVLAHNLIAALDGRSLRTFTPRQCVLYLLACGDRQAIASWGRFSAEGAWVWRWKDFIDRRFVRRFSVEAGSQR